MYDVGIYVPSAVTWEASRYRNMAENFKCIFVWIDDKEINAYNK